MRASSLTAALLGLAMVAGCDGSPTTSDAAGRVDPVDRPAAVRGIYVNAQAAGDPTRLGALLDLADGSAVNTFAIDVKERGEVSYASGVPLVGEVASGRDYIGNLPELLGTLRDRSVYPIARIVCFRDAILAGAKPEWAIRTTDGDVWLDPESNLPWVDPYNREVWAYNIDLAREALAAGFAEVQWDYVRFPDVADSVAATMVFPAQMGRTPGEAIQDFIATSRSELADFQAPITADVFGRVITVKMEPVIGQDWDRLVRVTDVLLPIVYPALYPPGSFGVVDPNSEPYLIVRAAMDSAVVRLRRTNGAIATIRPWLQGYSWGSTVYGPQQIGDQIRAVEDAGLEEWLLWNPESAYSALWFQ